MSVVVALFVGENMSTVKVGIGNYQKTSQMQNQAAFRNAPNFRGASSATMSKDAEKFIMNSVEEKMTKQGGMLAKLSKFLGKNDGELQTQTINAIFTSSLAPLFIAMNPFSNEDKKTKIMINLIELYIINDKYFQFYSNKRKWETN